MPNPITEQDDKKEWNEKTTDNHSPQSQTQSPRPPDLQEFFRNSELSKYIRHGYTSDQQLSTWFYKKPLIIALISTPPFLNEIEEIMDNRSNINFLNELTDPQLSELLKIAFARGPLKEAIEKIAPLTPLPASSLRP